jgi:hypothetical protein
MLSGVTGKLTRLQRKHGVIEAWKQFDVAQIWGRIHVSERFFSSHVRKARLWSVTNLHILSVVRASRTDFFGELLLQLPLAARVSELLACHVNYVQISGNVHSLLSTV